MFHRFALVAALLAPATGLAADQAPTDLGEGSEKDICDQIGEDQVRCAQAWRWCHWDPVDGKCERNPSPGPCTGILDEATCNATPGCIWDVQDPLGPRCENIS
ncbi:hypothetical protein [Sorangium sp. So ce406]|uniref:hypothetical protein n=1 Tax=Sorangium sp. So ce406 TaxID=3133311 RepID=UPI003F5BE7C8